MTSTLALAYLLLELCGILLAMEAIYRARTTQGAIAWSISLVIMPLLAIPAYLGLAGRRFHGYVKSRQARDSALQVRPRNQHIASERQHPHQPLEQLAQLPMTDGNHCRLLINGESTYREMFHRIRAARHYLLVQFYMVRDDRVGRAFAQLLIERAQAGIPVYFLFDAIGSVDLSRRYLAELTQAGVKVQRFISTKRWSRRWQINFRNHRKLVVVDGEHAFIGGLNVGDEYLGEPLRLEHWRDTHVLVSGPAAQSAQVIFFEDWHWCTGQMPTLPSQHNATTDASGNQQVLVLATGPADSADACELAFLELFRQARERLWLVSPYFVPSESIMHGLQLAALRGVDVRILLPAKADNWLVQLSSYAYTEAALRSGIRVYRYHSGFLHQKVLLLDHHSCLIGTANLDNRSLHLNFEIGALIHDPAFASKVAHMLSRDLQHSRESQLHDLRQRPLPWRFAVKLACLLAPLQ